MIGLIGVLQDMSVYIEKTMVHGNMIVHKNTIRATHSTQLFPSAIGEVRRMPVLPAVVVLWDEPGRHERGAKPIMIHQHVPTRSHSKEGAWQAQFLY